MSIFHIYPLLPPTAIFSIFPTQMHNLESHSTQNVPLECGEDPYPCLYLSLFCDFAFSLDKNGPRLDFPSQGFTSSHLFPSPPIHSWLASFCILSFNVFSAPTLSLTTSGEDHHLLSFQFSSKPLKISMYCSLCLFQPIFAT